MQIVPIKIEIVFVIAVDTLIMQLMGCLFLVTQLIAEILTGLVRSTLQNSYKSIVG